MRLKVRGAGAGCPVGAPQGNRGARCKFPLKFFERRLQRHPPRNGAETEQQGVSELASRAKDARKAAGVEGNCFVARFGGHVARAHPSVLYASCKIQRLALPSAGTRLRIAHAFDLPSRLYSPTQVPWGVEDSAFWTAFVHGASRRVEYIACF